MSGVQSTGNNIKISFKGAIVSFLLPLLTVIGLVLQGVDIVISMGSAIFVCCICCKLIGFKWDDIQNAALSGIGRILTAILIMILVGMLIGVWMSSASVPAMLYYGMKIINPKFFLPITFVICLITSMSTGTSWGTVGTMGIALIGIAEGVGIPVSITAGAIISGALVGDKLSPLSDTTLLASASSGTDLFDHITSMLYTTIPASIICIVAYTILGFKYSGVVLNTESVNILIDGIETGFNISILSLIPVIIVLLMSIKKIPALVVFPIGIVFGILWAVIFQGASFISVLGVAANGFVSDTGISSIDGLLSRGGAMSMAHTIYMTMFAGMFAGILNGTGILNTLIKRLEKSVRTAGGLVLTVTLACISLMVGGGGQYCTLTLPGVAFRNMFDEMDVHSSVLSRTMEDSGTLIGAAIPWDVSALFYSSILGVGVGEYVPFAYLLLITPILNVIMAYMGIGMFKSSDKIKLTMALRKS